MNVEEELKELLREVETMIIDLNHEHSDEYVATLLSTKATILIGLQKYEKNTQKRR